MHLLTMRLYQMSCNGMEISESKRYIDYKVYDVMKIKNKYGFRIKLILYNNEEIDILDNYIEELCVQVSVKLKQAK